MHIVGWLATKVTHGPSRVQLGQGSKYKRRNLLGRYFHFCYYCTYFSTRWSRSRCIFLGNGSLAGKSVYLIVPTSVHLAIQFLFFRLPITLQTSSQVTSCYHTYPQCQIYGRKEDALYTVNVWMSLVSGLTNISAHIQYHPKWGRYKHLTKII